MGRLVTYCAMLLAACTGALGDFDYCGSSQNLPYTYTLGPFSSEWLMFWYAKGDSFTQSCLLVATDTGSDSGHSGLELSIGCSPYLKEGGPWTILKKLDYYATKNASDIFHCPTSGYFYLFGYNPMNTSVDLLYQQTGIVQSGSEIKPAKAYSPWTIPQNLRRNKHAN
eukprot:gb/GECG01014262.1/.p1 GENE.gb/GECG01014262.1/~~gb/GECG01014262.1/.p1  ORF type:complete len:168 (+),score=3.60 gb/GECG01014262.1/:1-504(+)